ncbi:hypothetical protein [Pseudoduganella sp. GCM10020061]|uniref:hypothetical protein n=1 Tax=Pseudoduganella sp. GCM10020061 TaxID=3317345 RepID=UPI00362D59FD
MRTVPTLRLAGMLWRQAVLHRRSQGSLWLTWALLGMLGLLSLAPITGQDAKLLLLPAVPLALLGFLWGVAFVAFCSEQYWQLTAGLVPGLRAGIRRIMIGSTLSISLVLGAAAGALLGAPALWIAGLLFVLSAGILSAWGWLIFLAVQWLGPEQLAGVVTAPAGQAAILLAAVLFWWRRLQRNFPGSDAAVIAARDRRPDTMQKRAQAAVNGGVASLWMRWSLGRYWRDFQEAVRARRRLAIHVIGDAAHWSQSTAPLLVPAVIVLLVIAFTDAQREEAYLFFVHWLLIAAMWHMSLSKIQQMVRRLAGTVAEQGVLRLAPGIPAGAALTREMVAAMWMRWLLWWTASTAGVLLAYAGIFDGIEEALRLIALLSASLVMSAQLVRDFTRAFKPLEVGSVSFLRLLALTWALLGAFLAVRAYVAPLSWSVLVVANVIAAACVLRMRWRALERAPGLFPVARFA